MTNKTTHDNEILFDITTIITLISDICNDKYICQKFGSLDKWKEVDKNIYNQIIDELSDPVLPKLKKILDGKKYLMTKLAKVKIDEIIEHSASKTEQKRYHEINIFEIDNDPSDRFKILNDKIWTDFNKSIFGTADKLQIPVITGNIKLLTKIHDEHRFSIQYIAHRTRCRTKTRMLQRTIICTS